MKKVKKKNKSQLISDLAEAFNDIKMHESGKKRLKLAKDLIRNL